MKYSSKKPLLIALAIPAFFVSMVVAVLLISRIYASPPAFNFIYASGVDYSSTFDYRVISGKLQKVPRTNCPQQCTYSKPDPQLYLYDVKAQRSTEISFDDALRVTLDSSQRSPDGYRLIRGDRPSSYLFSIGPSYDSFSTMQLSGAGGQFQLNLASGNNPMGYSYGSYNMNFIGWVIP